MTGTTLTLFRDKSGKISGLTLTPGHLDYEERLCKSFAEYYEANRKKALRAGNGKIVFFHEEEGFLRFGVGHSVAVEILRFFNSDKKSISFNWKSRMIAPRRLEVSKSGHSNETEETFECSYE